MKLYVSNLILEVTRQCNMRCEHCLRGEAQRLNMSRAVIDKVLSQVHQISQVTFTGGEPSLNIPAIEYFTSTIKNLGIGPDSFYVVTNGKDNSKRLVDALIDLYDICEDSEQMCGLAMSRDQYHGDNPIPKIFKALKFFHEDDHAQRIDKPLNEGRAEANGLGEHETEIYPFENTDGYDDDSLQISEELYIAANGNVISNCNLSFKRIDAESFGNILTTPLIDIIQQHTKVEERKAA